MTKRILTTTFAVIAALAIILVAVYQIPVVKETINGWFERASVSETVDNGNNTVENDPTEQPSQVTNPTEDETSEETTAPTEDTEDETENAESELKVNTPVYADVEAFVLAILDNQYNAVNIAPEKAVVYDVRPDMFVNAEIPEEIEVFAMINGKGIMTIVQDGYEFAELVESDNETAPVFKMCSCKEHKESWDSDMSAFHWHVVENNEAMKANMFSRHEGTKAKVVLNKEAIEMLIAAGQYWYNGDIATTGIRICGKLYEAPKPVVPVDPKPEVKNFTVTLKHVDMNGKTFGIADKQITVKQGDKYTANAQKTYTAANGDKYTLAKYSTNNGSVVNGNMTVYAYYNCEVYVAPQPEVKNFTVTLKHVDMNGKTFGIADKQITVKQGDKYTANAQKTYTAANGDKYTLAKYSSNNGSVVNGNMTVYAYYNCEVYVAPLKDYTVRFEMSSTVNGRTLPYAVTKLTPDSMTVKEGTQLTFTDLAGKIVEVSGGKWICTGYDPKSVTVKGDMTVKVLWTYEANQVIIIPVPEVEYHTVEINYVTYDGSAIPASVLNGLKKAETVKEGNKFSLNMSGFSYINAEGKTYEYHSISRNNFIVGSDCEVTVYFIKALELSDNYPTDTTPEHTETEDNNGDEDDNTPEHTVPGGNTEEPKDDNPLDDDRTTHPEEDEKEESKEVIPEEEYNHPKADEDTQKEIDDIFGDRTDEVETNDPVHSEQTGLSFAIPVVEEKVEETVEIKKEEALTFAPIVTETESSEQVENVHSAVVTENDNALSFAAPVVDVAESEATEEAEEETESLSLMAPVVVEEAVEESVEATEETVETGLGLSFAPVVDDSEVADESTQNELDALFGGRE